MKHLITLVLLALAVQPAAFAMPPVPYAGCLGECDEKGNCIFRSWNGETLITNNINGATSQWWFRENCD